MKRYSFTGVALVAMAISTAAAQQRVSYPVTQTTNQVDDFWGTKVADPYRWMEDLNAPAVAKWVKDENDVTNGYLASLPMRDQFKARLTELWNYQRTGIPFREGGRLFYRKNSGLQKQSPLYSRVTPASKEVLVLDPNTFSADGSLALSGTWPSPDGKLIGYGIAEGGADWRILYVRDLATGKQLGDTIRWLKGGGMSWTKDGKGFFYSRFPEPESGKQLQNAIANEAIYYHRIGTKQADDKLIYRRPDHPDWFVNGGVTDDGRFFFIYLNEGTATSNRLLVKDLGNPRKPNIDAPVVPLFEKGDAEYGVIDVVGTTVYMETDLNAPKRKIVAFDIKSPSPENWRTVVAEGPNRLGSMTMMKGRLVVGMLEDVKSRVNFYALDGKLLGELKLPGIGTVDALSARQDSPELWYNFTSPLYPSTVFRYDPATGKSTAFEPPKMTFDPSRYETRQFFAPSKDGTRVPIFVTARKGLILDGTNPTMLYGYGGFDISTQPGYRTDVPAWLEQGGVWVTASMRGGGEYGEEWHKAGMFEKKQNVFDDFIAAAEYLVKEKYTSPAHLGIMGGSNGGLLVGAVMQQRPDLFGVALPAVGVMDMLRYHRFTGGGAWATEYGSADDPTAFTYLIKYSPVHNIRPGTCYPATLVTTADHDDRVVPSHSFKFTAGMQAAQGCDKPILIRVETQGSHGYRPTDKAIAEAADEWSFAAHHLGITTKPKAQ